MLLLEVELTRLEVRQKIKKNYRKGKMMQSQFWALGEGLKRTKKDWERTQKAAKTNQDLIRILRARACLFDEHAPLVGKGNFVQSRLHGRFPSASLIHYTERERERERKGYTTTTTTNVHSKWFHSSLNTPELIVDLFTGGRCWPTCPRSVLSCPPSTLFLIQLFQIRLFQIDPSI